MSTMTPYEVLTFACRMTSSLSEQEVKKRVDQIITSLALQSCKDTYIGGHLLKGISGGERKRTSIGYELITNPSLLLLDEPTSGLDSSTSLRIIRMMR
jgi:ABC-type multidrug transport system ATPase subunit